MNIVKYGSIFCTIKISYMISIENSQTLKGLHFSVERNHILT